MESHKPDIVLFWDRCDIMNDQVGKDWIGQEWDNPQYWQKKMDTVDEHLKMLSKNGAIIVFILIERPGKLLVDTCKKDHPNWEQQVKIDGFPPLCYLLSYWHHIERWREFLANRKEPNYTFIEFEDVVCKDQNVPCDDSTLGVPHNRFDGVHFRENIGAKVIPIIYERVLRAAGFID